MALAKTEGNKTEVVSEAVRTRSEEVERTEQETEVRERTREVQSGLSLRLGVQATDPNFYYCWVNDRQGDVQLKYSEGFDFVTEQEVTLVRSGRQAVTAGGEDQRIRRVVGGDREPEYAYLMKLPMDQWQERQDKIAEIAENRARGALSKAEKSDETNQYKPKGMTSMKEFRV